MGRLGILPSSSLGPSERAARRAGEAGESLRQPGPAFSLMSGSGDVFHSAGASPRPTFTVSKRCPRTKPRAPVVTRRCYE